MKSKAMVLVSLITSVICTAYAASEENVLATIAFAYAFVGFYFLNEAIDAWEDAMKGWVASNNALAMFGADLKKIADQLASAIEGQQQD